jgi:transposase
VEGAWASRDSANVSRHLQRRLEQQPKSIQDMSWKAQVRLCTCDRRLIARGQHTNQVVVAMARALVGLRTSGMAATLPGRRLDDGVSPASHL